MIRGLKDEGYSVQEIIGHLGDLGISITKPTIYNILDNK